MGEMLGYLPRRRRINESQSILKLGANDANTAAPLAIQQNKVAVYMMSNDRSAIII